jgi:hypothetical protein
MIGNDSGDASLATAWANLLKAKQRSAGWKWVCDHGPKPVDEVTNKLSVLCHRHPFLRLQVLQSACMSCGFVVFVMR